MGSITYGDGLSILELIVYLPSFLSLFSLSTAMESVAPGAAAVCNSIGLSPLLMACLGMLSRANESIQNATSRPVLHQLVFIACRVITIVALALSVSGLTWDMSLKAIKNPKVEVQVGMILYLVSWALLCVFLGILFMRRASLENGENRNLAAVVISALLLLVRIIYALLLFFLANSTFNFIDWNLTVRLFMSVIEEIAVVFVCLSIGYTLGVREKPVHDYKTVAPRASVV